MFALKRVKLSVAFGLSALLVTLVDSIRSESGTPGVIFDVLEAMPWDNLILVCDDRSPDCPVDAVLSRRPAKYIKLDMANRQNITHMLETVATPDHPLHFLVFCDHCETLLDEINTFEKSHDLQGYLTFSYRWVLRPFKNDRRTRDAIGKHLGDVTNVLIVGENHILHTGMFGGQSTRYLQEIHMTSKPALKETDLFPNLRTGLNGKTLTLAVIPFPPYVIPNEASGSYR
jgi:hypothetical protein